MKDKDIKWNLMSQLNNMKSEGVLFPQEKNPLRIFY